jgi:hypothetical protein
MPHRHVHQSVRKDRTGKAVPLCDVSLKAASMAVQALYSARRHRSGEVYSMHTRASMQVFVALKAGKHAFDLG